MNYTELINEIADEIRAEQGGGKVAAYIPELQHVDAEKFGLHLHCLDGHTYAAGDTTEKFSLQSITKVFSLAMAIQNHGDRIFDRIDVEPSGTSFNSLVLLEYEEGIPRNPFVNSGALVVADLLVDALKSPKGQFIKFCRELAGSQDVDYNYAVAESEKKSGFRNRALANMLKAFGTLHNDVDEVLDFYYHQCSVEMSCAQLAEAFTVFANAGRKPGADRAILSQQQSQRINALMQTCGFYDEAGEFAFRVGLPGKSGVGGGIAAVYPGKYSVAVWSPPLNEQSNSLLGMKALERLTTKTGMAIF